MKSKEDKSKNPESKNEGKMLEKLKKFQTNSKTMKRVL